MDLGSRGNALFIVTHQSSPLSSMVACVRGTKISRLPDFRRRPARRAVCFLLCLGGVLAFGRPGDSWRRAKMGLQGVMWSFASDLRAICHGMWQRSVVREGEVDTPNADAWA